MRLRTNNLAGIIVTLLLHFRPYENLETRIIFTLLGKNHSPVGKILFPSREKISLQLALAPGSLTHTRVRTCAYAYIVCACVCMCVSKEESDDFFDKTSHIVRYSTAPFGGLELF